MKKLRLFGLLCTVGLFSCCQNSPSNEKSVCVIDARSRTDLLVSTFSDAKVVLFESTKDSSMVGVGINKIEKLNGRLYLLNRMNSRVNLLCFDTSGRFIHTLDQVGEGVDKYGHLNDFLINQDSTLLLIAEVGRYMVFDTVGKYVSTIWQQPPYYYDRQFVRTNDSTCVVFHNGDFPKGSDLLEVDSRTFAIRKSAQATDILASEGARPLSFWNGRLLYYNMNDTIYDATDIQKRVPLYYLDFGKNQRKTENKMRELLAKDRNDALIQFVQFLIRDEYIFVTRLFENTRWIAVSAMKQDPEAKKDAVHAIPFFVLYDKETGRSYNSDYISWDILNLGPLKNIDIVGCDDRGTLYALWYGIPSDSEKQKIGRGDKLPQEVKDKLSRRTDEDNPVLFMLR